MEPVKGGVLSPTAVLSGHDHVLNDLDDVEVAGAIEGETLVYTGQAWVPGAGMSLADEVNIRPDTPPSTVELWVDTDEVYPLAYALGKVALASYAPSVDPVTVFTTVVDISTLSVTWTADPTRLYRTTVVGQTSQITAGATQTLYIANAANTVLRQINAGLQTTQAWQAWNLTHLESGLTGSQTRKARVSSNAASGQIRAQTLYPFTILVEDIGLA